MRCLNCNKVFIVKRRIIDILSYEEFFICDSCLKEYPVKMELNIIPLVSGFNLHIISILDWDVFVKIDAYIKEFSLLVSSYIHEDALIYDVFDINERNLFIMDKLSKLISNDIYIYTFKCRI